LASCGASRARSHKGCGDGGLPRAALSVASSPAATRSLVSRKAGVSRLAAGASTIRIFAAPVVCGGNHRDAVDRARRQAELTTRAVTREHGVHMLRGADNGIDRAGGDAKRATNAGGFIDARDAQLLFGSVSRVERLSRHIEEPRQLENHGLSARGATIDRIGTRRNSLGVGTTSTMSAATALCLRQQGIDAVGERRSRAGHGGILPLAPS